MFLFNSKFFFSRVIKQIPYGKSVDWWCFGIFIYELNCGKTPFQGKNSCCLYDSIIERNFAIPDHFSESLQDICQRLLEKNQNKRLGCLNRKERDVSSHEWFKEVNWKKIFYQEETPAIEMNLVTPIEMLLNDKMNRKRETTFKIHKTCQFKIEFEDF